MYAIVKCGGKQLKVAAGDKVAVERLDAKAGETVTLSDVLLLGDGAKVTVGTPLVKGAKVVAEVMAEEKGTKVIIFKKRRRQNYRRKLGHRQIHTVLKITAIQA